MNSIGYILKNHLHRAVANRHAILTTLGMTLMTLFLAIYFTSQFEMKSHIAVVTDAQSLKFQTRQFQMSILEEVPPTSALVRNKYDAVLIDRGDGQYDILTLKNEDFKERLQQAITDPEAAASADDTTRGIGTNIFGFLVMLVLLEGLLFMNFFTEDKQYGTFKRTVVSPAGIGRYLIAQCLFTFSIIYVPTLGLLMIVKEVFGIDIGFAYSMYAFLLAMLACLAAAFALFMAAIIEKTDNMLSFSASIIVLTSLISGSFYAKTHDGIMETMTQWLPQKQFLTVVQGLERQESLFDFLGEIGYVFCFALVLLGTGIGICTRKFRQGHY